MFDHAASLFTEPEFLMNVQRLKPSFAGASVLLYLNLLTQQLLLSLEINDVFFGLHRWPHNQLSRL
jgi:hypothetical protein